MEPYAPLIAHKVDVGLALADILGPGAVQGNHRALGANHAGDGVVHVIGAVLLVAALLGPHIHIGVVLHVLTQLAEGLAGDGLDLRVPTAIHDDVQIVHAPVDKGPAPGDGLGGKGPAQARDRAVGPEACVHVVHVAQLSGVDILLYAVDAVVKTVHNADVQHPAGLVLDLLHLQSFGIGPGGGLLAEHVLTGPQGVDGYLGVDVVGGAHGHRLYLRVI